MKVFEYTEDNENIYMIMDFFVGRPLFDRLIEEKFFHESFASELI